MARYHHEDKIIDNHNGRSQKVYLDKQQPPDNDMADHEINNTPKPTKEQKQEISWRKKSLREHITSESKNLDQYADLEEYLFSWAITSIKTLGKEWKKNPKRVWD